MPTIKDYVAAIQGICGGESEVIVLLEGKKKDLAIANIMKRCVVKKTVSFMSELEFNGVTFRVFSNGRIVFRGVKNRKALNRLLAEILL